MANKNELDNGGKKNSLNPKFILIYQAVDIWSIGICKDLLIVYDSFFLSAVNKCGQQLASVVSGCWPLVCPQMC